MLVLGRKEGEEILIGPDIKITICNIHPSKKKVRIGIEAPADVHIVRPDALKKTKTAQ